MSGGLDRRPSGSARSLAARTGATVPPPHVDPQPVRPVRHCWVVDDTGARAPGLLVEWRRSTGWEGRVAYVVDDGGEPTLVEAWVPAEQLQRRTEP